MPKIDKELADIFKKYGGDPEKDLWDCHGTWVAYHKALERIGRQANIIFDQPFIIESDGDKWSVSMVVTGRMQIEGEPDRVEWSVGEASQHNYRVKGKQTAYPWAMCEKRAKDRVILKLIGLHGMIYSEEEADDFKKPSAYAARKDGDYPKIEAEIRATNNKAELNDWYEVNAARINALPALWVDHAREEYARHLATFVTNSSL